MMKLRSIKKKHKRKDMFKCRYTEMVYVKRYGNRKQRAVSKHALRNNKEIDIIDNKHYYDDPWNYN